MGNFCCEECGESHDFDAGKVLDILHHKEILELVKFLTEDGYIKPDASDVNYGVSKPNLNDNEFWESLEYLKKCRSLLTTDEEEFILSLAKKYVHLR